MSEFRRILIIKPSSLGDIVHALPTLSALRRRFPHAHIAWLVKREWAEILDGHEDLDEVIPVDLSWHRWSAIVAKLRRERFDLVADLQGLFRSGLLAWVTGSSERIGFAGGREGSALFYTQRVRLSVEKKNHWRLLDMHAVERNLKIAAHLGADISTPRFSLPAFPDEEKRINVRLNDVGVRPGDRLIALAPRDRLGIRSWPLERFVAVGSCLSREQNVRIVLIGMPTERSMVKEFSQAAGDRLVDLVGMTTIRELVVLLRRAHLLIANDSAPMHIAAAVGTRVVGLFGPTNVARARPYGDGHTVLHARIPCSPCEARTCANRNRLECLTSITVQQVVEAARAMMGHETEQKLAVLPHP